MPGIVHRYPDRVLLKIVGVCPVYCRFCFRREMVGPEHGADLTDAELAAALDYVRATPAIWEVILTGGDPFVLSPRRVEKPDARHRRHPACQSHPLAHARAGRRARSAVTAALVAALAPAARPSSWRCTPIIRAS